MKHIGGDSAILHSRLNPFRYTERVFFNTILVRHDVFINFENHAMKRENNYLIDLAIFASFIALLQFR